MIMTPTNRYGLLQALTLAIMPLIDPCLLDLLINLGVFLPLN
jgi:hypothetical protein